MSVASDTNNQHPPLNSESEMEANRPLNTNEQHQDESPKQESEKQLESGEQQNTSPQSDDQKSVKDLSGNRMSSEDKKCEKDSCDSKSENQEPSESKTCVEQKCSRDAKPEKRQSSSRRTPRALVIIAEGSEESEAVITIDMLRRSGVEVILAGLNGSDAISGDNKIKIVPDTSLEEVKLVTKFSYFLTIFFLDKIRHETESLMQ